MISLEGMLSFVASFLASGNGRDLAAVIFLACGVTYMVCARVIRSRLVMLKDQGKFDPPVPMFLSVWSFRNWEGVGWVFGSGPKAYGDRVIRRAALIFRVSFLLMFVFGLLTMYLSVIRR